MAESVESRSEAAGADEAVRRRRGITLNPRAWIFSHSHRTFYLCIAPWAIGFLAFTLAPFLTSAYLSLTRWHLLAPPKFRGVANFSEMFVEDHLFRSVVWNTIYFTLGSVPGKQLVALALAMLLNQKLKGIWIYRSIFYLPAVTSGVATAILWTYIFGYNIGILNAVLQIVGLPRVRWLTDVNQAMRTMIMMSFWNVGSIFLIYLAGLQGVPDHLYEAAEVDGAGVWSRFRNVTLPMISPSIFFNIVMGIIGSFQGFTAVYVMTGGGPADRTLLYGLHIYYTAFQFFRMGYAAAMAWVLFSIILVLTLIQLRLSERWVYYEAGGPGGGVL
jgi:multiple sugar transport system permease protein